MVYGMGVRLPPEPGAGWGERKMGGMHESPPRRAQDRRGELVTDVSFRKTLLETEPEI